jgi:hypothetical protein
MVPCLSAAGPSFLNSKAYIFKMVYPSMDYYTVRTAPLPVLLISLWFTYQRMYIPER